MTTITHNGKTARINARRGDTVTTAQAKRLINLLGAAKTANYGAQFTDGHQLHFDYSGARLVLRHFAHMAQEVK